MQNIVSYMTEWIIHYLRNKDIVAKNIISIDIVSDGLLVKYKNSEQFYKLLPSIVDCNEIIQKIKEHLNLALVLLNSRDNFQIITQNWKRFIDFPQFTILFINPFSQLDTKWIINPYIHNKICDNASLLTGLKSIFGTVEPISEDQFKRLVSNT
jgi:hypothetical protein